MVMELFHRLGDAASARIRKRIVELGWDDRIAFRNVHFDSHRAALEAHGTLAVPAIWDGTQLHVGEAACLAVLAAAA
jgi:hypothetical protein